MLTTSEKYMDSKRSLTEKNNSISEIKQKLGDFYSRPENSDDFFLELKKIISKLQDIDLSLYRKNYLNRRLYYRIIRLNISSYKEYLDYIRIHPEETAKFVESFTIHVTEFFRDSSPFRYLENELLLKIAAEKENQTDKTIRILSAPCSTGEEPYSIAIICEHLSRKGILKVPVKIFACDIDNKTIDYAMTGEYPSITMKNMSEESIGRNFTEIDTDLFLIKPYIRSYVTFFVQDLLKPIQFQNFDLVLCRNFLIYISKDRQKVVIDNILSVINPNGYLMLGKTEGFPLLNFKQFSAVNIKEHIYQVK